VELVEYVWKNRGQNLTLGKVMQQPQVAAIKRLFRGMTDDMLQVMVTQMLRDIRAFPINGTTSHEFVVGKDEKGNQRVGYLDEVKGAVDYYQYKGYLTAFAYAHSVDHTRKISDLSEKSNMMGINLYCGKLPYADLPNYFDLKLGLTGSLESASQREMGILKSKYHFNRFSVIPSIFPKKPLNIKEAEVVGGNDREAEFFKKIKEDMIDHVNAGRACLVVLDDLRRLEEFWQFLKRHRFNGMDKLFKLTGEETTTAEKEHRIAQAARTRHMTLITRAFGRGSDFVCRDNTLVAAGGMHVIQAFASELKSEEVQIKGRTCRQDDPGSYKQYLFATDLAPFGLDGEAGITEYETWTSTDKTWTKFIDIKREEVLLEKKFGRMNSSLQSAERDYVASKHFVQHCEQREWDKARRLLCSFCSSAPPPESAKDKLPRAVVFVVDRTWRPILDTCITAIESMFRDLLDVNDSIGVYSLGEGWIFAPALKGPNVTKIQGLLAQSRKETGQCMLYCSILQAVRCLEAIPDVHRWLVVLSDTVDLENLYGVTPLIAGQKALAQENPGGMYVEGTVSQVHPDNAVDITFASGQSKRVQLAEAQPIVGVDGTASTSAAATVDTTMQGRLRQAGASSGRLRISLKWDTTDDLDLHVQTPHGEIFYSNRRASGGELDVDRNVNHDTTEPVENVFWNDVPTGNYEVFCNLYSRGGDHSNAGNISYMIELDSRQTPVQLDGQRFCGVRHWNKSISEGKKSVFSFSPTQVTVARDGRSSVQPVRDALARTQHLSMALIDSSKISGWEPSNPNWPTFRQNVETFNQSATSLHGNDFYHFEAENTAGIAQKFQEVATLMVAGSAEKRVSKKAGK